MDIFKWIIRLIFYPAFIFFIISVIFFYLYSTPKKKVTGITPADLNLKYEEFYINTIDDIKLSVWFIPNEKSRKAIILLHGWPADKGDILVNTTFLSKRYNLLYIDFRAMGKSGGRFTAGGYKEINDIKAGVEFLKKRGITDISLYGYSMGGFSAILYSLYSDDIKAVIADSPYDSIYYVLNDFFKIYGFFSVPVLWFIDMNYKIVYGVFMKDISISGNIKNIKKPTLIICGDKDDICYSKKLYDYNKINKNIETFILKDFSHNETIYYKNYENIINDFFTRKFL